MAYDWGHARTCLEGPRSAPLSRLCWSFLQSLRFLLPSVLAESEYQEIGEQTHMCCLRSATEESSLDIHPLPRMLARTRDDPRSTLAPLASCRRPGPVVIDERTRACLRGGHGRRGGTHRTQPVEKLLSPTRGRYEYGSTLAGLVSSAFRRCRVLDGTTQSGAQGPSQLAITGPSSHDVPAGDPAVSRAQTPASSIGLGVLRTGRRLPLRQSSFARRRENTKGRLASAYESAQCQGAETQRGHCPMSDT